MPTLGQDCHIILSHAEIDGGAEYGFLLSTAESIRAEGVQIVREVSSEDAGVRSWVHFDVYLADRALNPDGSLRAQSRAEDYAKLLQFLDKPDGIALTCPAGTLLRLGSLGWSADERHKPHESVIKCQLNNVGYYFPPVDPALLNLSIWDGTLTWGSSYWR